MNEDIELYKRRYDREKNARIEAETLLENKSRELYLANEALKNLTTDLEQLVLNRTAELKKAHDLAIAHSNAKTAFLANMSHEIRTPMNGILGVIHLLESDALSQRQHQLITTAKNSSELLLAIINDILDVSKIEAGEITLESIQFNLCDVITSTIDSLKPSADKKSLHLTCQLGMDLPYLVKGDPTRIRQIISNLISNAIKFTSAGEITTKAMVTTDGFIEIAVIDQGIGIPPEKLQDIFSPFTQADESITRKFGGTGLGLAICKHFSKTMGKEIQVVSELGKGSTFTFWLKLPYVVQTNPDVVACQKYLANSRVLIVTTENLTYPSWLQSLLPINFTHCHDLATTAHELTQAKKAGEDFKLLICSNTLVEKNIQSIASNSLFQALNIICLSQQTAITQPKLFAHQSLVILPADSDFFSACKILHSLFNPQASTKHNNETLFKNREKQFTHNLIMLVDDNSVNREIGSEILREQGLSVECFENGEDAVKAITQKDYQLILMDVQMPIMDGLTATKVIRGFGSQYAKIPIIAMTAHAQSEDIQKSLHAGMNAHLTKPIQPEKLFSTIKEWLPTQTGTFKINASISEQPEELPPIEGIDIQDGLMRANYNQALFKKVLIAFLNAHKSNHEQLQHLLDEHQFSTIEVIAHKLKGSGSSIGAKSLASAAAELEQQCKSKNYEPCASLTDRLITELGRVLSALSGVNNTQIASALTSCSTSELNENIEKFMSASTTDFTLAEQLLTQILAAQPRNALSEKILAHFDAFDMEALPPLFNEFKHQFSNNLTNQHPPKAAPHE